MTITHTQERLVVATDGTVGSIETESGTPIGHTFQVKPMKEDLQQTERRENARRLVACWNACIGIETEALEGHALQVIAAERAQAQYDTKTQAAKAIRSLREWVQAVPQDTPLPAMPGIDGDWLDAVEAALAQEPAQPDRHAELKSWSLLAARALDDCHRVIETIVAESSTEEEKLNELDKRVYELFNQALCLHGLMTRTQLDKVTGFGRVEVTGPIDKPAVQEPERVPPIGFTWIDFRRELQGAQWAAITPGWTQALEMVCARLLEIDAAQQSAARRTQFAPHHRPRTSAVSGLEFCELPPTTDATGQFNQHTRAS
mgnify:CR=1 FL=1